MNKLKGIFENKFFIVATLILVFGAISVLGSGTIGDQGFSGIQVDNYYSGSGKTGITQNVSFIDLDGSEHLLEIEDGLVVNYSLSASSPYDEGVVSYYKFEGISGNVVDSAGDNNGTNIGATRGVEGKINNSFSYDGINDFVNETWLITPGDDFSISAWFNANSTSSGTLFSNRNFNNANSVIQLAFSSGNMAFIFREQDGSDEEVLTSGSISTGTWYHTTATYDDVTKVMSLYINGDLVGSTIWSGNNSWNNNMASIGATYPHGQWLQGRIDEVGLWNRTLSRNEVSKLFNNGAGLPYAN